MGHDGIATPAHTVQVSAFNMAKYETTGELWDAVRLKGRALGRGYTDLEVENGNSARREPSTRCSASPGMTW